MFAEAILITVCDKQQVLTPLGTSSQWEKEAERHPLSVRVTFRRWFESNRIFKSTACAQTLQIFYY